RPVDFVQLSDLLVQPCQLGIILVAWIFHQDWADSVEPLFAHTMPLLFPSPSNRAIQADAIDPGGYRRVSTKIWNGAPDLSGDVLEQILLILRCERVGSDDLEKQALVAL